MANPRPKPPPRNSGFKPGQSGNPNGPKPGRSVREIAGEVTQNGWTVINFLAEVMLGTADGNFTGTNRVEAAKVLLERYAGRPVDVTLELDPNAPASLDLSSDALETLVRELKLAKKPDPQATPEAVAEPDPKAKAA